MFHVDEIGSNTSMVNLLPPRTTNLLDARNETSREAKNDSDSKRRHQFEVDETRKKRQTRFD